MMNDWNALRTAVQERVAEFAKLSPGVVRGIETMDAAAAKSGMLESKIHELIALAVAVTTRCDGCIAVHTKHVVDKVRDTRGNRRSDGHCNHPQCRRGHDVHRTCARCTRSTEECSTGS
jgi:alkylhydroperoxidase family enzyme